MTEPLLPLYGRKTHALSAHAREVLDGLSVRPAPSQTINPGVVNRLLREGLVEHADLPSPYASHKGKLIGFLAITDAGRAVLKATSPRAK